MKNSRPSLFIGSSSEGLSVAKAMQINLDNVCDVEIWHQGTFGLSGGTLQSLLLAVKRFDFAALVLTPDDLIESRGQQSNSARDNVLFELGLFMGSLGQEQTFVVFNRSANLKLPSDLAGVTMATYNIHSSGNLTSSLGAASSQIEEAIKKHWENRKQSDTSIERTQEYADELLCQYDWYNEVGYRDSTQLKAGIHVLYEEHALFPELDEGYYKRLQRIRIPTSPYQTSPRGFVKISQSDGEWHDPRNRNRRIHETIIHSVLSPTEVAFGEGNGVGIQSIVDILEI